MKAKLFIPIFITLIIASCGPSQQEIEAREKAKIDSVAQATALQITHEREVKEAAAAETKRTAEHIDSLNQQLIHLRAKLEAAQIKLQDSMQFQFLRTADEKTAQIQATKEEVERLKYEISQIENQLPSVKF